jgi:sugar phosphate isomerase/epimerase
MKYAFMTFSAPRTSLDDLLRMATCYGYDGIEPRIGSGHAHGIETSMTAAERRAVRDEVAASGITVCCIATSCTYADPATAPQSVEDTRRAIALAADLGVTRLRVFGGKLPAGMARPAAVEQVASSLRSVADEAAQHGVVVCLETHDDWTDPADVAAVMRGADHPAIAVNWDYMHTIRVAKWSVDDAWNELRPWVKHVHMHDGADRADELVFLPIGEGDYDHRRILTLLLEGGYNGFLSGEWINWEPAEVHLPRELQALRAIEHAIANGG